MQISTWLRAVMYLVCVTIATSLVNIIVVHVPSIHGSLSRMVISELTFLLITLAMIRAFRGSIPNLLQGNIHKEVQLTLTLLLPLYASTIAGIAIKGQEWFYQASRPAFIESWNTMLPMYAAFFWLIGGLIVVLAYIAAPYELFEEASIKLKHGRLCGILGALTVFSLNYNGFIVTHKLIIEDIVFFGLVFAYSYSIYYSPLALLAVYMLSEAPLWWSLLAPLGPIGMTLYADIRLVIALLSLFNLASKSRLTGLRVLENSSQYDN